MSWKQPIPTNLETIFGEDYASQLLYRELIYRACNEDAVLTLDGKKFVTLKRGQVLFGRNKYGKYLGWDDMKVSRTLTKICEIYKKVSIQPSKNYTIVSIENYDEVVDMSKQRASSEQAVSTSKSVKNNKEKKIKKKRKPQGVLFGSLPPLDYPHIYQIAQEMMVTIDDVRQIDKEVRLSVETGNKYNLTNQVNAVRLWVNNALKRGEMQVRNEVEDMIFSHQSPEELAHDKVITEQLKVKYPNLI